MSCSTSFISCQEYQLINVLHGEVLWHYHVTLLGFNHHILRMIATKNPIFWFFPNDFDDSTTYGFSLDRPDLEKWRTSVVRSGKEIYDRDDKDG